jgi:type IV pilus assembly protein PilB
VAQRLVRKLCPDCKEAYEPTSEQIGSIKLKADLIYKHKGCPKCNHTGFRGRSAVGEVMFINEQLRDLLGRRATYQELKEAARANGMQTLYGTSIKKVESGITSLEEALSITLGQESS